MTENRLPVRRDVDAPPVGYLTLDGPGRRNALSDTLPDELVELLARTAADPTCA